MMMLAQAGIIRAAAFTRGVVLFQDLGQSPGGARISSLRYAGVTGCAPGHIETVGRPIGIVIFDTRSRCGRVRAHR